MGRRKSVMEKFIMAYEGKFAKYGIFVISTPLFLMTLIDTLNALGRKLFMPFPCCLEAVESLLVISVYLGVSIVAAEGGHVSVTITTQKLPQSVQYGMDAFANFLGALTFCFWGVGAWREAFKALSIMEMRIGVYRFPLWPFRLIFAFGVTMLTFQLVINMIRFANKALGRTDYATRKTEEPEAILQQM
ncbi:MAG: TRAP transporter small permease [Deltaproteobacteria bacterium]|nr:MAG: TRAP transporter small permease [Deltaproteobacteria bacterium]